MLHEIPRLYSIDDAQFKRSPGVMLGPQIIDGNRFTELINGDRIFPKMLEAIRGAQKTILFETYIYWSGEIGRQFADALSERARDGVKAQIIMPGKYIDTEIVRRSSRGMWGDLLEAGVEIHEYQPTMFHCKVMIVDRLLVSVGSTNFDDRSFRLNDEANLNIYDSDFARRQIEVFEQDLANSKRITFAQWQNRPMLERSAAVLGPLL